MALTRWRRTTSRAAAGQRDQISDVLNIVDDEHRSCARRDHLMRVFRPIVDRPVEAVRLDVPPARADASANRCLSILDAQTRLIGTSTAQPIRIGIGSGKCHRQRASLDAQLLSPCPRDH
jgi:hypothetical protein